MEQDGLQVTAALPGVDVLSAKAVTGCAAPPRSSGWFFRGLALLAAGCLWPPSSLQAQTPSFDSVSAAAAAARVRGDAPEAIQLYSQAVALNAEWPEGWWFLGTLQYGADHYAAARDALTHFIELTPKGGAALALRGLCEFETGQYPESLQDIQRGIALSAAAQPRNASILYYHEALLSTRLGRFEEAVPEYGVLVKQGNINDDVAAGLGLTGMRVPSFPKDVDPSQAQIAAMVGPAAASILNGDVAAGNAAFQQVFERFPQTANLHYFYGYLLFSTDPDQAAAQFQQELTVAPSSALAHSMLAWTAELRGEFAEALPNAEKAATEDPSLPAGQLVLGRALVETGDTSGGLPHLENVLRMEPANLEAHLTVAKAYSRLGRKDDARRERLLCLELAGQGAAPTANP